MSQLSTPARTLDEAQELPEHLQLLEDAVLAVENDEQFKAWLDFRSRFHNYSWANSLLIQQQFPGATVVAGYKAWKNKHGRQVRKGEKGIVILAPLARKREVEDASTGETTKKTYIYGFRGVRVFDVTQTDGPPFTIPDPPPRAELTGETHAERIPELIKHAEDLGISVSFDELEGCEGYFQPSTKTIAVQKSAAANAQVRILIHELIHAHGTSYEQFGRALAETITDSATYVVCRAIGLDVTPVVAQYVAGWSNPELRKQALAHIDYYAAFVERALGLHERKPHLPKPLEEVADA